MTFVFPEVAEKRLQPVNPALRAERTPSVKLVTTIDEKQLDEALREGDAAKALAAVDWKQFDMNFLVSIERLLDWGMLKGAEKAADRIEAEIGEP